eukprot:3227617-Pleurochrysis_carterae.AAC.1
MLVLYGVKSLAERHLVEFAYALRKYRFFAPENSTKSQEKMPLVHFFWRAAQAAGAARVE